MSTRDCDVCILGKKGLKRLFTIRAWMFLAPLALVALSVAANMFLWRYYADYDVLKRRADDTQKVLAEQKAESYRLKERMDRIRTGVSRISSFNDKLGVMVNFSPEEGGGSAGVGSPGPAFNVPGLALLGVQGMGRRMNVLADYLTSEISLQEALQQELLGALREKRLEFDARPSLWPIRGEVSSSFGMRRSPFGRKGDFHKGIDIRTPSGTPVRAPGAGVVTEVGYMRGYGLRIVLTHDYGISTVYAHLRKALVAEGQTVKRGEKIALSGNSGRSTGPHLHYEVHLQEQAVNPMKFLFD